VSASEIATPAWPSNSELRLEAMQGLPAHRRLCPVEGFSRGLDSLHKRLGAPAAGHGNKWVQSPIAVVSVFRGTHYPAPRRGQRQPQTRQSRGRPPVGMLSGSLIAFTLRGPRTTAGRRRLPDGFVSNPGGGDLR